MLPLRRRRLLLLGLRRQEAPRYPQHDPGTPEFTQLAAACSRSPLVGMNTILFYFIFTRRALFVYYYVVLMSIPRKKIWSIQASALLFFCG